MPLAEHEVHRVLEHVDVLETVAHAVLRGARAERDREVDVARAHAGERLLRLEQRHRQLDRGMSRREARDGHRHQRRRGRLEGGQAQPPAAQAGDRLELGLGLGEPGEDGLGVADDGLARLRQPHPAGAALDEHRPGLALERGDLLGDGRLREGEGVGGGGERALEGDLAEDAHAANVEHQKSLYELQATFICTDGDPPPQSCS